MPFAFLGLATIHALARGKPWGAFLVVAAYLLLLASPALSGLQQALLMWTLMRWRGSDRLINWWICATCAGSARDGKGSEGDMEVILLERVANLGQLGEVVKVKPGYARNFLLPKKKALRATKDNLAYFERQKGVLEAGNAERRKQAEAHGKEGSTAPPSSIVRQAAEGGQLYGSVSARDIADAVSALGHAVERQHVVLNQAIKTLGLFKVAIALHPEVSVTVTVNVARSEEEAKVQAERGEALIGRQDDEDEAEEAAPAAEIPPPPEAEATTDVISPSGPNKLSPVTHRLWMRAIGVIHSPVLSRPDTSGLRFSGRLSSCQNANPPSPSHPSVRSAARALSRGRCRTMPTPSRGC